MSDPTPAEDSDTADPLAETFTDFLSSWLPTPFDR